MRQTVQCQPAPLSWDGDRRVLNVAHRGACGDHPENTLAAIRAALALGVDSIELDVQRSRDGALVLIHDTTLTRTTDAKRLFPRRAPWNVADFDYDELILLDAGAWKGPFFAGERIPTLDQAIDLVRTSSTGLLLELKAPALYPGAPGVPVGLLGAPARANLPALGTWGRSGEPAPLVRGQDVCRRGAPARDGLPRLDGQPGVGDAPRTRARRRRHHHQRAGPALRCAPAEDRAPEPSVVVVDWTAGSAARDDRPVVALRQCRVVTQRRQHARQHRLRRSLVACAGGVEPVDREHLLRLGHEERADHVRQ